MVFGVFKAWWARRRFFLDFEVRLFGTAMTFSRRELLATQRPWLFDQILKDPQIGEAAFYVDMGQDSTVRKEFETVGKRKSDDHKPLPPKDFQPSPAETRKKSSPFSRRFASEFGLWLNFRRFLNRFLFLGLALRIELIEKFFTNVFDQVRAISEKLLGFLSPLT